MLKKYGKLIALFIMLIITTEVIIYFNNNIDSQLTVNQNQNMVDQLRNQLDSSDKAKDLNPYHEYWVFELEHFYKDFPDKHKDVFFDIELNDWNQAFQDLVARIETVHVDDITFMSEVSNTIKQFISVNYLRDIFDTTYEKGYFRSVMMLMEDDQRKQS